MSDEIFLILSLGLQYSFNLAQGSLSFTDSSNIRESQPGP